MTTTERRVKWIVTYGRKITIRLRHTTWAGACESAYRLLEKGEPAVTFRRARPDEHEPAHAHRTAGDDDE